MSSKDFENRVYSSHEYNNTDIISVFKKMWTMNLKKNYILHIVAIGIWNDGFTSPLWFGMTTLYHHDE